MPRKPTIAILASTLVALAAAPAGASAAEACPPGTPSGPYCIQQSGPGLTSSERVTTAQNNSHIVNLQVRCAIEVPCKGTLSFEAAEKAARHKGKGHKGKAHKGKGHGKGHKGKGNGAGTHTSANHKPKLYAQANYDVASGETTVLLIHLHGSGRKVLQRIGSLKVNVVASAYGGHKRITKLTIRSDSSHKGKSHKG